MKHAISLLRVGAVWSVVIFLLAAQAHSPAQETNAPAAMETKPAESDVEAELLKAYVHLQAQLNEAQLAIEQTRVEYQASARAQAAAITEKLGAIQTALEQDRARQQEELQKSNRALLWVAAAFGGAGLLAMVFTAMLQWQTMNRVAEISAWRPQLTAGGEHPMLPALAATGGKVIELSNQRLMAVIERLERRVFELEHTTGTPSATADGDPESPGEGTGQPEPVTPIAMLLGKGQSLLDQDQPELALACYDEILQLDANHPEALVKKGATLERLKQDDEALRCYDRAIQADGTLTIAYLYKGGIYNRLERYNEALECYEQALQVQARTA